MARPSSSRVRRLLLGTTALSIPLILLGIYTAIAGFGLTCEARWPLCDGAVFGLFPANWGSFVEWFHRLVAMVFGFAIVGTALSVYRNDLPQSVNLAVYAATVLTPLQIVFGALTVGVYQRLVLATHFVTAILIFVLLVAAAVRLLDTDGRTFPIRRAAGGAVALLVLGVPLVPGSTIAVNLGVSSAGTHVGFYFFTLLATGAFVAGGVGSEGRIRGVALAGGTLVVATMVISRVALFPTTTLAVFLGLLGSIAAAVVLVVLAGRSTQLRRSGTEQGRGST